MGQIATRRALFTAACIQAAKIVMPLREFVEAKVVKYASAAESGRSISSNSTGPNTTSFFQGVPGEATGEEGAAGFWSEILDLITRYEPDCEDDAALRVAVLGDDSLVSVKSYRLDFSCRRY